MSRFLHRVLAMLCVAGVGCGGGSSSGGASSSGGGSAGTGGAGGAGSTAGVAGSSGWVGGGGAGNAPGSGGTGNVSGSGASGGTAGTGGGPGGGGVPGGGGAAGAGGTSAGCPAKLGVTLDEWSASPWTAPSTGSAEQVFTLSTESWKHYARLDLDLKFDTTAIATPYVCFLELRNVGANQSLPHPWRYFSVCVKTGTYNGNTQKNLIYVVYDAVQYAYLVKSFTIKANTSYSLNLVWDATVPETTMTLTEAGGSPIQLKQNPVTSSIVPQGQGLKLLVGFNTNHPDYQKGIIMPPWGWSFSDLKLKLTPGGPLGSEAPPCP